MSQVGQRFSQMNTDGREISKVLVKIGEYFGVGKGHPNWKDYVQHINQKVRVCAQVLCCVCLEAHTVLCRLLMGSRVLCARPLRTCSTIWIRPPRVRSPLSHHTPPSYIALTD